MAKRDQTNRLRRLRFEPLEPRRMLAITVDTLQDVVDANDGVTSLREAVIVANATQAADTIGFAPALTASGPASIILSQRDILITRPLTISGPGSALLTIDASGSDPTPDLNNGDGSQIFRFQPNVGTAPQLAIVGLRMTGGDARFGLGGALEARGVVDLRDVIVEHNYTYSSGGGVYIDGATTISDSIFQYNIAERGNGGGLGVHGNLTIIDSIVSHNMAYDLSGGIDNWEGNLLVDNCEITFNTAKNGGGIQSAGDVVEIRNSNISNNRAIGGVFGGGGLFNREWHSAGRLTIISSTISNNEAQTVRGFSQFAEGGGGILNHKAGTMTVKDSIISGNSATGSSDHLHGGGGISLGRMRYADLLIARSRVDDNVTTGRGGAIYASLGSTSITDSTITGNESGETGGGINTRGSLTVVRSSISANHTAEDMAHGGGIFASGLVTIGDSSLSGNYTLGQTAKGGGLYAGFNSSSSALITFSTVSGNYTQGDGSGGGGVFSLGRIELNDSTLSGNATRGDQANGGGALANTINLQRSTVVLNSASGLNSAGGGVAAQSNVNFTSSIVALNTASAASPDIKAQFISASATLIGDTSGAPPFNAASNILNVDPKTGPLSHNGGPTLTHALLPGSPAIDMGPAAGSMPQYDQRGAPWLRMVDGDGSGGARADIGSFELQPNPLPGDYNFNDIVDAADYVLWRKLLASTTDLRADGSGNGTVDQPDYDLWRRRFGQPAQMANGGSAALSILDAAETAPERLEASLLDAKVSPARRGAAKAIAAVPVLLNKVTDDDPLLTAFLASAGQNRQSAGAMPAIGVESGSASINIEESLADAVDRAFELFSR